MNFLRKKWPFWLNAILLILMVLSSLYLFDDAVGFAGLFNNMYDYAGDAVREKDIPGIDWSWQAGLLAGVFAGGVCGSLIHGNWKIVCWWEECSGAAGKFFKTVFGGIFSGFMVMFGAILCGEVFCGQFAAAMELSAGAWFFLITALASGGITALFIERCRSKNSAGNGGKDK